MAETITVDQLVERTRRWLIGMTGVPLNALITAAASTDLELELGYDIGLLTPGNYVGLGDEIVYVWEVNRGSKTATVSRGVLGTEASAHEEGALVEAMTRFPRAAIKDSLQDEIRAWPDNVFAVGAKILDVPVEHGSIDLGVRSDNILNVLHVARAPMSLGSWAATRWTDWPSRLDRDMPRDIYPSGCALTFYNTAVETCRVRVLYAKPFDLDSMDDELDVVEDLGLGKSMCDIPPLGAAARLLEVREIQRTDTESMGESRIAAEVPATFQTQTANALRNRADKRLRDEAGRLRNRYRMPT